MSALRTLAGLLAVSLLPATYAQSPARVDPVLARHIATTRAFDNHAHPILPPPNDATDRNFDALPVDSMEPQTDPTAWRLDNPQLPAAWKALWDFTAKTLPLDPPAAKQLAAARARVKAREATHYDEWLLDKSNIETQLANRVTMGSGVAPPRFRWVPYADALVFPLDNSVLAEANPDRRQFFPLEDRVRALDLHDSGLSALPPTLAEYLARVVTPTLERQKAAGAVAEKFEIAYLRPFGFPDTPRAEADRIYARWIGKPRPDSADYKRLQDFLFRYIAAECGRLDLPVHLHTMSGGGGYFDIAGANPLLLEPLFNDPRLRKTRFVLLHGGWPFVHEIGALLQKPNVYLDLSQQTLTFPPRTLSTWLREWLETFPGKVLFGTDGYPYSDAMGWEDSTWIAARNGREALGLALTGMIHDGEITPKRAAAIATQVLRENALTLYPAPEDRSSQMANRYGEAALIATRMETYGKALSPNERWQQAVKKLYPNTPAGQNKNPPRLAFLGLCEAGLVQGIPAASPTAPNKSKTYATEAAALLTAGTHKTVTQLWNAVTQGEDIQHASQMDVVLALWKNGLLTALPLPPA